MSNPGFGQRFRENLILFAKKTTYIYYIGAQFGYGILALFQLETSGFAALLKVGHLAICLPSASQIIRFPHILACYIVIIDPGDFWCGDSQLCQTFAENAHDFSQISIPGKPSEVPQIGDSISAPASHHWRPRAIVVLGVHCGPFREQKLRSLDAAAVCRVVQRRLASGGFPGPRQQRCRRPWGRRKLWEC